MKSVFGRDMKNQNNYIVVTGGGTGGHLSVARSFIYELYDRGFKVIFIGSTKGADKDWFEEEPKLYKSYFLETQGVVNQGFIGKIKSLSKIFKATIYSLKILNSYKVKKVISVGGFSASPASFASALAKCDLYIHEQNSVMGRLNQITSKWAKEVFSSYDKNATIKDYPINPKFFEYSRVRKDIKIIIFLGGSQGATAINDFALLVAPILKEKNINIIHQTGKNDYQRVKDEYKKLNIQIEIFDFSKDILSYMDKADFAVSRSGASTLWELSALGLPTLFIPYPYAASNHQYHNAKFLLENNLCFLTIQNKLNKNILDNIFNSDIKNISEGLIYTIQKDGIKKIIDYILT